LVEDDAAALHSLNGHLSSLASFSDEMTAAVALFDFSTAHEQICHRHWPMLAAKSGAMNLRNFRHALVKVLSIAGSIPALRPLLDTASLKEALNHFDSQFSRVELLRHAVAHPENYSNPRKDVRNREPINLRGKMIMGPGNKVKDALVGRTYASTIDEKFLTYELDAETALTLVSVTKRVYTAVERADPYSPQYYLRT
jgi:hypothetical protein